MTIQNRVRKLEKADNGGTLIAYPVLRFDSNDGRINDDCTQVRIRWLLGKNNTTDWQMFYREEKEAHEEFSTRAFKESKDAVRQLHSAKVIIFLPECAEHI